MSNDGSAVEATLTKTKSIDFQIIEIKLYDSLPQDFSLTETLTGQDFVELLEEDRVIRQAPESIRETFTVIEGDYDRRHSNAN